MAPETPESFAEKRFQRVSSRTVARASNHLVLSRGWHERPRGPTRFIRSDTSNLPQRYSSMPSQGFQRFGSIPVCHKSPAILPVLFLDSGVPWRLTLGMFAIGLQRHWRTDLTLLNGTTSGESALPADCCSDTHLCLALGYRPPAPEAWQPRAFASATPQQTHGAGLLEGKILT